MVVNNNWGIKMNKSIFPPFLFVLLILAGTVLLIKVGLYSIGYDITPSDPYYEIFQRTAYVYSADYWIDVFF